MRRQTRSLIEALIATGPGAVIAEVKRSSPSQGEIVPTDRRVAALRRAGCDRDLGAHRSATSAAATPTSPRCDAVDSRFCKDFMVDVWQVTEAREYGADAILVIMAMVETIWRRLMQAAEDQGTDARRGDDEDSAALCCSERR